MRSQFSTFSLVNLSPGGLTESSKAQQDLMPSPEKKFAGLKVGKDDEDEWPDVVMDFSRSFAFL
jgi:hypothetical protein